MAYDQRLPHNRRPPQNMNRPPPQQQQFYAPVQRNQQYGSDQYYPGNGHDYPAQYDYQQQPSYGYEQYGEYQPRDNSQQYGQQNYGANNGYAQPAGGAQYYGDQGAQGQYYGNEQYYDQNYNYGQSGNYAAYENRDYSDGGYNVYGNQPVAQGYDPQQLRHQNRTAPPPAPAPAPAPAPVPAPLPQVTSPTHFAPNDGPYQNPQRQKKPEVSRQPPKGSVMARAESPKMLSWDSPFPLFPSNQVKKKDTRKPKPQSLEKDMASLDINKSERPQAPPAARANGPIPENARIQSPTRQNFSRPTPRPPPPQAVEGDRQVRNAQNRPPPQQPQQPPRAYPGPAMRRPSTVPPNQNPQAPDRRASANRIPAPAPQINTSVAPEWGNEPGMAPGYYGPGNFAGHPRVPRPATASGSKPTHMPAQRLPSYSVPPSDTYYNPPPPPPANQAPVDEEEEMPNFDAVDANHIRRSMTLDEQLAGPPPPQQQQMPPMEPHRTKSSPNLQRKSSRHQQHMDEFHFDTPNTSAPPPVPQVPVSQPYQQYQRPPPPRGFQPVQGRPPPQRIPQQRPPQNNRYDSPQPANQAPPMRHSSDSRSQFAQPSHKSIELPHHPAPIRPGLISSSQTDPTSPAKPPPMRQYEPAPSVVAQAVQAPATPNANSVTVQELERLRQTVRANPHDFNTAFELAKKLVEAAAVLADEGGNADIKTRNRNRERYTLDAHKLLKKLSSSGHAEAAFYLADCHGLGKLGLEVDPKEAYSLYLTAAKAGHPQAAYRVAVCCELGQDEGGGTRRDPLKAIQWYKRAATLGDTAAMYKVGMIMLKGLLGQPHNPREAITWLKRAAEKADAENPHALHELALLYETAGNNDPIIRDEHYAKDLYIKASELGYKFSQFRLGQAYEFGHLGLPIDARQSIQWYSCAAVQQEHQSELALSGWYLTGSEGILQQSDTEAYLWARKAAKAGLAKAEYAMGYFTEVGIGAPANVEDAKRWYWRAASQNYQKARDRLEDIRKGGTTKQKSRVSRSAVNRQSEGDCTVM